MKQKISKQMDDGLIIKHFVGELALLMAVQISLENLDRGESYAITFEVQNN